MEITCYSALSVGNKMMISMMFMRLRQLFKFVIKSFKINLIKLYVFLITPNNIVILLLGVAMLGYSNDIMDYSCTSLVFVIFCPSKYDKTFYARNDFLLFLNVDYFSDCLPLRMVDYTYINRSLGIYHRRKLCIWNFRYGHILGVQINLSPLFIIFARQHRYGFSFILCCDQKFFT